MAATYAGPPQLGFAKRRRTGVGPSATESTEVTETVAAFGGRVGTDS